MRILIAAIHYPVASARYMRDAFKRLGVDVRTVGYSTGNQIWGVTVPDKYAWKEDGDLTMHWPDWTPDLVLVMDSAWAYHHPVYGDVPHAVYGVDSHVRDYRQPGIARYFLAHKAVSVQPYEDDTEWLPCGFDPQWFTPSPIPYEARQFDVCMLGVMYEKRAAILNALGEAGLNVVAGTGAVYEQYRDYYWNSRISLCVSAAGDVAQRVFETAAMGCAVLSDPLPDLEALNADGVTLYEDPAGAVKAAKWLLKNEDAAKTGQAWAMQHTWDARAARIVEWWRETYAPKPKRKAANDANA